MTKLYGGGMLSASAPAAMQHSPPKTYARFGFTHPRPWFQLKTSSAARAGPAGTAHVATCQRPTYASRACVCVWLVTARRGGSRRPRPSRRPHAGRRRKRDVNAVAYTPCSVLVAVACACSGRRRRVCALLVYCFRRPARLTHLPWRQLCLGPCVNRGCYWRGWPPPSWL